MTEQEHIGSVAMGAPSPQEHVVSTFSVEDAPYPRPETRPEEPRLLVPKMTATSVCQTFPSSRAIRENDIKREPPAREDLSHPSVLPSDLQSNFEQSCGGINIATFGYVGKINLIGSTESNHAPTLGMEGADSISVGVGMAIAAGIIMKVSTDDDDEECCIACEEPLEDGDPVYWDVNDTGHIHAACCGPERESYVNADGEPLKDGEPIPEPFAWRPER